jgi:hypothetical protein
MSEAATLLIGAWLALNFLVVPAFGRRVARRREAVRTSYPTRRSARFRASTAAASNSKRERTRSTLSSSGTTS